MPCNALALPTTLIRLVQARTTSLGALPLQAEAPEHAAVTDRAAQRNARNAELKAQQQQQSDWRKQTDATRKVFADEAKKREELQKQCDNILKWMSPKLDSAGAPVCACMYHACKPSAAYRCRHGMARASAGKVHGKRGAVELIQ